MVDLVIDDILKLADTSKGGKPQTGKMLLATPGNQYELINPTTTTGGCTGLYYSIIFQLPKWGYKIKKLDEWMDVSPIHAETYNITVEKRHQIEGTIKQSLAQVAGLVADYELAKHDLRKYKDILDFWKKGKKDDHVLRSLFIDRVDVHTGEGLSIISMARRWPTIISDFIKMSKMEKDDRTDVDNVRKFLNVTVAEANVLKTKNDLYDQWTRNFFPDVKERYARIKTMVQVRERSIDQYRQWLKPYVARHKMMMEKGETNPASNLSSVYISPGFGTAFASSGVRFITWKSFEPPESNKPQYLKEISPIDHVSRKWAEKISERYNIKIDDEKIEAILERVYGAKEMNPESMYYNMFDINISKSLVKVPKGSELEDMDINIKHWIVSQNVMLAFLLEIYIKEEVFNRDVDEMIGVRSIEERMLKDIEKEMEDEKAPEKKSKAKRTAESLKSAGKTFRGGLREFSEYFFRPGPYENNFKERVTKWYMIPMGAKYFNPFVQFIKWKMGVPGAEAKY